MPLPDFDTLKRVDTPDFDTLRPVAKTGTNPPASPSHDEEADASVTPDPTPSNRPVVNIKLNPYEESFLKTGLRDPERAGEGAFTAELSQHLTSDVSNLARGITADIAAGFRALGTGSKEASEFSGNIVAALQREPMPIDKVLKDISGEAPATATIGKISQGIAATAPMLALGALPKALQTAALIGFTGKMIADAPEVARSLGDELGKPKDQQNPDRISSLVSEAIQITGFSIAGGFAMGTKMGAKLGTDPTLAAKSEAIKPVAPLTAQAVKEIAATPIPAETPKEKGSTDALVKEADKSVRDVQSQSGEVKGEVSTPKRSLPADERGSETPATQTPSKIVAAAYKPDDGPPVTGANHPEILNRLGIQDYPTRESRNTPQFGFVDEAGKFLTRPEAAQRSKITGQQMEAFDVDEKGVEHAHSNEIASTTEPGKPIALAAPVEPPISPEPASPQSVAGKEGETAGAEAKAGAGLSWEKTPSVRPGGKQYFWTAKTDKGVVRAVWNRATKKWSAQGLFPHDSIGEFETTEQAKAAVERSLGGAEAQTAPERPSPKKPKKVATTPSDAVAKAEQEVKSVAKTEGQRPAKEVKSELVSRIEDAIKNAPNESDVIAKTATKASGKRYESQPDTRTKVTIDIPDDGTFTVWNTKENLGELLSRAKKIPTTPGEPVNVSRTGISAEDKRWIEEQKSNQQESPASTEGQPLKGMGAALLGEVDKPNDSVISNMFAAIDRDRAAMGKPPMPDTQRRSWDEDNTRALNKMNRDPDWIPDLIKEVLKRPRPLLSWENAGLVWQRQKWTAELNNALQRISTAYEGGVDESLAEAKIDAARFEDNLEELDRAVGRSGTGSEAGRTLQAQKMGAGEDFTLIEMRLKKRAAVGGRPLTDTESAEIERLHKELDEAKKKHDTEIASRDQRLSEMANKLEVERLAREAKREPTVPPHIKIIADQVKAYFDKRADAAQKRLSGKLFTISPQVLADLTDLGISKILSGAIEFGEWSVKMAEALGEKVKPHLKTVWESSQSALNDHIVKIAGEGVKGDRVKRAVRGTDLQSEQERVTQNIKSRMDSGKKNEITSLVQHLARVFVEKGVKERDPLIDAVHGVLKEIDPEFTRRETMDAISGYGDFRQLSKDTISKELRDLKGQMQQVAKLEDMQAGEPPLKTGVERRIPSKEESRLIKLVNDAKRQFQIPISDPDTQLRSPLDTLKKRMQTRIDELNQKIADKDYRPKQKREIVLDEAAMQSKVALDRIVKKYREGLLADRLANRTPWEKALDWVTKYRRFGVLSSPIVIPKLISAGAQRLASVLPEDIAGEIWSRAPGVSKVAEKAPLEGGGVNLKAAMKGFGSAFSQGIKDAYDVIKTGHSDLDVLYGKAAESYTGESEMGSAILAFPGRLHGMIKAPVKRARFVDAAQRLGEYYANQGLNVSDPMVQMRIGLDAYKAAQRSIFLQDNRVASAFSAGLRRLEQPDKATGKPGVGGKVLAVTARTIFPIVRVPLNIVAETFQYAAGLGTGGTRLAVALAKGVEKLTPEQADLIMRELKKGSIGGALLITGYFTADSIGGYYQPGHKKKEGDLKWGSIRVFGHDVPSYLLHNPLLETLQIGATLRHVADSKLRKKDSEAQGLTAGAIAAAIGVVEQVPFVREQLEIQKAMNPYTRHQWFGEQVKSITVPAVVQKAAEWTDPEKKRNPTTIIEHVKSGIPGLREQVPTK